MTMKAHVTEQPGSPDVLQLRDVAAAEPGANELQIHVRAS